MPSSQDVTQRLLDWSKGDRAALDDLLPLVYGELRRLANHHLRRERPGHTLQPTALVHEAYMRLINQAEVNWQNRAHFFGVAANLMRQILIQHARAVQSAKRGGDAHKLSLEEVPGISDGLTGKPDLDLIALDDALNQLAAIAPQQGRVVELRYFGGLSIDETAEVLGISPSTVKREWTMAKAWLHRELSKS